MYGKSNMETYNTICKIDSLRINCVTQGSQTGTNRLKGQVGRWEGGSGERGHGCAYG